MYWRAPRLALVATWVIQSLLNKYVYISSLIDNLIFQRLLDHTPTDHPDYAKLQEAEGAVHALALKINSAKEQKQEHGARQNTLKTLELLLITEVKFSNVRDAIFRDIHTIHSIIV